MTIDRKILIVDEYGFSKICSALLSSCGYHPEVVTLIEELPKIMSNNSFDLIVTSYPYGTALFELSNKHDVPTIILTDGVDERLISILSNHQHSFCMIKPVDYDKFRSTVRQAVERTLQFEGGYCIV